MIKRTILAVAVSAVSIGALADAGSFDNSGFDIIEASQPVDPVSPGWVPGQPVLPDNPIYKPG